MQSANWPDRARSLPKCAKELVCRSSRSAPNVVEYAILRQPNLVSNRSQSMLPTLRTRQKLIRPPGKLGQAENSWTPCMKFHRISSFWNDRPCQTRRCQWPLLLAAGRNGRRDGQEATRQAGCGMKKEKKFSLIQRNTRCASSRFRAMQRAAYLHQPAAAGQPLHL